jgi:hypothetical protein
VNCAGWFIAGFAAGEMFLLALIYCLPHWFDHD